MPLYVITAWLCGIVGHICFKLKLWFSGGGMLAHLPAETVCCWTVSKVCCTTGLWATLACPFVGPSGSQVEAQASAQAQIRRVVSHKHLLENLSQIGYEDLVWQPLGK